MTNLNEIIAAFENTNGTWQERFEQLREMGVFVRSSESLRKLIKKSQKEDGVYTSKETMTKKIEFVPNEEKSFSLDHLNDLFPEEEPEIEENNGKKFYVFSFYETEPVSGEKFEQKVRIPVTVVDSICFDYSVYGANKSAQTILNKYGLNDKAWNILKDRLNLNKLSNAISKQTLKEADADGSFDQVVEDTVKKSLEMKSKLAFDKKYEALRSQEMNKLRLMVSRQNWFAEGLLERLKVVQPSHYDVGILLPRKNKSCVIHISDIHFGRKGHFKTVEYFNKVASEAIHSEYNDVSIICHGDLVEAFTEMHDEQLKNNTLQSFGYGHDAVIKVTQLFEDFLMSIRKAGKTVRFYGITGNHDRGTEIKSKDQERTMGLMVYLLLKTKLSATPGVEVDYTKQTISTIDVGNIRYIVGHGDDRPFDGQSPAEIVLKHGKLEMYNMIVSGDKHTFYMKHVTKGIFIKAPCLATAWEYEKKQDYDSQPGYLIVVPNAEGKADVTLRQF